MLSRVLELDTAETESIDLTDELIDFCRDAGDGLLNVSCTHSTVGLAIIQPDDGSTDDVTDAIRRFAPRDHAYKHELKSRGHGADHLTPVVLTPSLTIPVDAGALALGTWQRVLFFDFDIDTSARKVRLSFVQG